jgi:hypothetical protein
MWPWKILLKYVFHAAVFVKIGTKEGIIYAKTFGYLAISCPACIKTKYFEQA